MPTRRTAIVAALAAGTLLTGGAVGAAVKFRHGDDAGVGARAATSAVAGPRTSTPRADRAVRAVPVVARLRRLTPPDVLIGLRRPAAPRQLARLDRMRGIAAVTVLDRGVVRLPTGRLNLVGVDPSAIRGFTPRFTAVSDRLWESVARGELTVSYSRAASMRGDLGLTLPVFGRAAALPLRVGAFASIGIGSAEGMVDRTVAAVLGLPRARGVLVSAPHLSVDQIAARAHAVFGRSARVHVLRPQAVDQSVISAYAQSTIPSSYLRLYRAAATTCPGLPWTVLAAIGAVETGHGADTRTSSKGAMGPMQFLPSTFAAYAVDGDGDGVANIQDPADAVYSAAHYLCMWGAGRGGQSLYDAIWAYNHADWYVREVLALAVAYS